MLTTTELIAGIQEDYADTFSAERLVRYLDRCQRMIFLDDTFELTYYNHEDPSFPFPIYRITAAVMRGKNSGVLTPSRLQRYNTIQKDF